MELKEICHIYNQTEKKKKTKLFILCIKANLNIQVNYIYIYIYIYFYAFKPAPIVYLFKHVITYLWWMLQFKKFFDNRKYLKLQNISVPMFLAMINDGWRYTY